MVVCFDIRDIMSFLLLFADLVARQQVQLARCYIQRQGKSISMSRNLVEPRGLCAVVSVASAQHRRVRTRLWARLTKVPCYRQPRHQ
jgi:hypothetical protein